MIGDVICNDCDISETFINSANIAPNNIYIYLHIDKQIDRYRDIDKYSIYIYIYIYILYIYMQLY